MNIQSTDLQQLSKDMITIQSTEVITRTSKADIFMSSPPLQKYLINVGEFILSTNEMREELRTFDHQTLDSKTVISNEFSEQSGDKSVKIGKLKPIPRKSGYSMPGKGVTKDTNIFSIPEVDMLDIQTSSISKKQIAEKAKPEASRGKIAAKENDTYSQINDVYHPDFNFDRFKSFIFSRPIQNKAEFQKFLLEIKADVEMIKLISMKEPCPPKVPLLKLDKSNLR